MTRTFLALSVCSLLIAGCTQPATDMAPGSAVESADLPGAATPLIPRQLLFGNPDKAGPQISPDGTRISYLAPVDSVLNVWVGPADDPAAAKPVTHDTGRGISRYFWAYTNNHILYLQDKDGDENWRVHSLDLQTGQVLDLTPLEGVAARIQEVSHKFPTEILIALNNRVPQLHDLYRVNIETGQRGLLLENDGFAGFITDDDFEVRYALTMTPDGGQELLKPTADGSWEPFMSIGPDDAMTTNPIGFDKSGAKLYLVDSRNRDTAALVSLDLESGELTVLAEDPQADIAGVMMHPVAKTVEAAASNYARVRWQIFDDSIKGDFAHLKTVADGDFIVIDRTLDDTQWIVAYDMDDGPVRYYRYDRGQRKPHFLFTNRKALEGSPLAKMHPVVIPARDGLKLVSYYTLPVWTDRDNAGHPAAPLPMVLLVHGGPWSRDSWGLDGIHQWLANRGYAVLSVNFRGSTGFGKRFINAADLEIGGKMHDDLLDAVDWAVKQRIADPKRVAIMGGSYGGYAVLWGLTGTPDVFACGVDIFGPSSLVTLLESIPPYWVPMLNMFTTRIGDHRTEDGRAFLTKRSPLTYVDRIKRPLLIAQGANDVRVKQAESDRIVKEMQQKGLPVTYALYSDEGHGFARPENRLSFFAVAESFLARHVGGRCEPIGNAFAGSGVKILAGAEEVPGLKDVLAKR